MYIKLLNNAKDIRQAFVNRFVMSWDVFQIQHKDWIAKMVETSYPITIEWYEKAFMWDRRNLDFIDVSMDAALAFLKAHSGLVYFMTDKGEDTYYQGKKLVDFVAEADANTLAVRIEQEWYGSYRLIEQNMYNADAFLPQDLYVFDSSMRWCVVFTHETTDWESEIDNPMKAAESRVCFVCEDKQ